MKSTPWAWSRCVKGTPNRVKAAWPEVMPLTTSTSMPSACKRANSSPPRPKTKGSPPLRRTTRSPCLTSWIMCFSMKAWGVDKQPPRLPTAICRALAGMCAKMAGATKSSTNTTVACCKHFTAFRVSKSGSPGPAPTKAHVPLSKVTFMANRPRQNAARCRPHRLGKNHRTGAVPFRRVPRTGRRAKRLG